MKKSTRTSVEVNNLKKQIQQLKSRVLQLEKERVAVKKEIKRQAQIEWHKQHELERKVSMLYSKLQQAKRDLRDHVGYRVPTAVEDGGQRGEGSLSRAVDQQQGELIQAEVGLSLVCQTCGKTYVYGRCFLKHVVECSMKFEWVKQCGQNIFTLLFRRVMCIIRWIILSSCHDHEALITSC